MRLSTLRVQLRGPILFKKRYAGEHSDLQREHLSLVRFFFKAEYGIRDHCVTGVQTCALPIWPPATPMRRPTPASTCWSPSQAPHPACVYIEMPPESLRAFPLKGDDTLGAGRPFLGVPDLGSAGFKDCAQCVGRQS